MANDNKKKSPGQWLGDGVLEFGGVTYGYGVDLPDGIPGDTLKRLKEAKKIGRIPVPVEHTPLDEENLKLKKQVESLKSEIKALKKGAK